MPPPADRLKRFPTYPFAIINQRVRELRKQGVDIIGLDVGSPDKPPPEFVVEVLAQAAYDPGKHGYAGYGGTPEFREATAAYYQRRFGVSIDPEREVLPLLGSKEGIVNLCMAYLDRGDVALVPDISYPSYSLGTLMAGGEIYWLPTNEANDFIPDLDAIPAEIVAKAKLLWINYPNNPTGQTVNTDFYQRAVEFCNRYDILLASDNPYCDVTYDGYAAGSALQPENAKRCTVEFISHSKTYNMAGWRLGAAVGSAEAIKTLLQVKSNFDSGHFYPVYEAGAAAMDETPASWIEERNEVYRRRRDLILDALPAIGLTARKPKGSLYIWGRVVDGSGGAAYVEQALTQAHVSLAPGGMYGPGGEHYVRFSLGVPNDRLEEALARLKDWYKAR